MARYLGLGASEPEEDSEKKVAAALKALPDGWVVFHHVSWQSKRGGRQGDGEADFVVLHPSKGVLVIEVKGGGVEINNGRWSSIDRIGERHVIKNPYEQASASKHALLDWLNVHGLGGRVRIGHAVIFPHMSRAPLVGPAGPPAISFAKPQLEDIEASIVRCLQYWELEASLSTREVDKVIALLAPTIALRASLSAQSVAAEANLVVMTAEQVDAFSGLRASRGGLVIGGAGTGKTILAIARAQQLARDGFRTLLVCYNELLGRELSSRTEKPPILTACTFHTLCLREAHRAGVVVPDFKPATWWETSAPNLLIEACVKNTTNYDAIVVDEAQDFSPLWVDALKCLISAETEAPFFLFADPLQDIWKRDWLGLDQPFTWQLTRNMRNTHPIAERVAAAVSTTCKHKGVPGPAPLWRITAGTPREKDVVAAVEALLDEGLGGSSVVVLCDMPALLQHLRERSVGPFSFGRWGGRGIAVETISRFKGLDAQAIVLVLSSMPGGEQRTQAYVGMSRARSILVVIGTDALRVALNWTPAPSS